MARTLQLSLSVRLLFTDAHTHVGLHTGSWKQQNNVHGTRTYKQKQKHKYSLDMVLVCAYNKLGGRPLNGAKTTPGSRFQLRSVI